MKKILASILASLMFITVLVGCAPDRTDEIVIATSGNNVILVRDFLYIFASDRAEQEMWLSMMELTEEEIFEFWHTEDEEGISQMQRLKERSLQLTLDQSTLLRIALDAGYTYDADSLSEREDIIDEIVSRLHSPQRRGEDIFFDFYMITPQDFKDMQKDMLTIEAFVDSVSNSIPVSEDEILEFLDENSAWIEQQFDLQATARHILISLNPEMTEEEREEAARLANEILARVQAGEDIGELAAIYSEDPGSAHNNGEYTFPRGMMVPEFENWAFSAQPGDVGIVETSFGYHIMYSVDVDTMDDHFDRLRIMMVQEELHQLITNMIEESNIEWTINEDILNSVTLL